MHTFKLSIIIPTVGDIESCLILESFRGIKSKNLYIQFVFLVNKKNISYQLKSNIQKFDGFEIITVVNDRYFGSCEENIYRVADFADLFLDYVFCVGEHDFIDWPHLILALERFNANNLGAMGWNIKSQQKISNGNFAELPAIAALNFQSIANDFCQIIFNRGVLSSEIAYPALISIYGPIDWAAYLGNHLFRKNVFLKLFQYKFSEHVYSLVYKQLLLFTSNQIRYSFYENDVIWRISDDFQKAKENRNSFGWLEDHRTVQGLSKCFWIANLQYLVEIKDKKIFNLVTNSLCFSQIPGEVSDTIQYSHTSTFAQILNWAIQVINHKLNGESYYFGVGFSSGSVSDIFTVTEYFELLMSQIQTNKIYAFYTDEIIYHLKSITIFLSGYLSVSSTSEILLSNCFTHLDKLVKLLPQIDLISINHKSFEDYVKTSCISA
jgi:hypothetical protein